MPDNIRKYINDIAEISCHYGKVMEFTPLCDDIFEWDKASQAIVLSSEYDNKEDALCSFDLKDYNAQFDVLTWFVENGYNPRVTNEYIFVEMNA